MRSTHASAIALALVATISLPTTAGAGDGWVNFTNQTASRLVGDPVVTIADPEEKDYAWGDLDQDGDIDLICVRKQPFDGLGRRRNVLFMNEGVPEGHALNGVLVDRTAEFASTSDVTGDQGFLTPTNDRDVKVADVNGDGWLDIITAVTLSDGQPKHISHPRVYVNLGLSGKGDWLGLQHQDARIPQLAGDAPSGFPHAPRFNNVAVGDVNGDGLPDLWFADADYNGNAPMETFDFGNRLLLNVGSSFADVTATNLPPAALNVHTAVSSAIADFNLDGFPDLVKHSWVGQPIHVAIVYNQPGSPGMFDAVDVVDQLGCTDLSVGDLNNDGRPDLVITDDNTDRYLLNLGNGSDGFANFAVAPAGFESGADDGFGGESVIADLDNDGFNDVVITDVDFTIGPCGNRRAHIYRNLGNAPNITLQEASPSVIPTPMLTGTHDAAVFDINGDGWNDLVLGHCATTNIWIQIPPCEADIAPSGGGDGVVNVNDLLLVIGNWGATGSNVADVNGDLVVNVNDLLAVVGAWGPCG